MGELRDLPPQALRAALTTGTAEWGQWGSAADHALYVQAIPRLVKGWRMCRCGCRTRSTHSVMANGVALASGCELKAHRTKREMEARYRPTRSTPPQDGGTGEGR